MSSGLDESFYTKILDCLHDQIAVIDRDQKILYHNQAFESFVFLNLQDAPAVKGMSLSRLFPDNLSEIGSSVSLCLNDGRIVRKRIEMDFLLNGRSCFELVTVPYYHGRDVQEVILILHNNTEMEMQRQELKHQVLFFSNLISRLPLGVFMLDLDGDEAVFSHWNPRMEDYFGKREKQVIGRRLEEIFDAETVERHSRALNQIRITGLYYDIPAEKVAAGGNGRYFHTTLAPIVNEEHQIESILGIQEDVTQKIRQDLKLKKYRQELEKALQSTSRQLGETTAEISSILNSSSGISIFSLDRDLRYRVFNTYHQKQMEGLFHRTINRGTLFPECLADLPALREEVKEHLEKALYGVNITTVIDYTTGDGNSVCLDAIFSPLYGEGDVIGVTVILMDITSQRQTEKEAEIFKTVADNAEYGVMITGLDLNIRYCNRYWETLFGLTPYTLTGKDARILFNEEQLDILRRVVDQTIRGGTVNQIELDLQDRNSRSFTILMSSVLVSDIRGKAGGIAFTCLDITPMKEAREVLISARDKAERASVMKSTFVANMSHEIRTPLNAVIGFAGLMEAKLSDPVLKSYLDNIISSGGILKSLINDILDFSKIEAGKMGLSLQNVEIRPFFSELYQIFSLQAIEKKLTFRFFTDGEVPEVLKLDPLRIRQIVINLVGNALKFTRYGYVYVILGFRRESSELILSVQDTGIGIPEKDQFQIFDPFEQQEKQDSRSFEGTGLGLAITRKLIHLMDGRIELVSDEYRGSLFRLILPVEGEVSERTLSFELSEYPEIGDTEPVCLVGKSVPEDQLSESAPGWGFRIEPAEGYAGEQPAFILQKSGDGAVPQGVAEVRFCSLMELEETEPSGDEAKLVCLRQGQPAEVILPVLRSLLAHRWSRSPAEEAELSPVSREDRTVLLRAVESRDTTDIEEALAVLDRCGRAGEALSAELGSAMENFDITLLYQKLNELGSLLAVGEGGTP